MPLVYDFKDIASRMKGELKQEPEPEAELVPYSPAPSWRSLFPMLCHHCCGTGVNLTTGNPCNRCHGSGVSP